MTVEKIIKDLSDAVVASGRPINTLHEAIFNYFKTNDIPEKLRSGIWQKLVDLHTNSLNNISGNLGTSGGAGKSNQDFNNLKEARVVDYSQNTSDLKKREPRKSVFGDIKKIAG